MGTLTSPYTEIRKDRELKKLWRQKGEGEDGRIFDHSVDPKILLCAEKPVSSCGLAQPLEYTFNPSGWKTNMCLVHFNPK